MWINDPRRLLLHLRETLHLRGADSFFTRLSPRIVDGLDRAERNGSMQYYRVYFLGADGRTDQTSEVVCADNEEALRRLAAVEHPHAVELWHWGRRIGRREAIPPKIASAA